MNKLFILVIGLVLAWALFAGSSKVEVQEVPEGAEKLVIIGFDDGDRDSKLQVPARPCEGGVF
jgi:hypothetical protein